MTYLDHIEISVKNGELSMIFYENTLGALGIEKIINIENNNYSPKGIRCGFGTKHYPFFWIHDQSPNISKIHLAFKADSRKLVDLAYKVALENGAQDNGPPGIRSKYHDHYYAAYVLDLDGNNLEFICQTDPA